MALVFVFVEKPSAERVVITFDRDESALPSSDTGWTLRETIDADAVTPDMGIVGVGNAAELIRKACEDGRVVTSRKPTN